jgi:hypothetical protein
MRRWMIAASILVLLSAAPTAQAAPAAPGAPLCSSNAVTQFDMAGIYRGDAIHLEMYPCGGSYLIWRNAYGTHTATYYALMPLDGGGMLVQGVEPDPTIRAYMDGSYGMVIKPAERGFIQIVTVNRFEQVSVYLLRKM